MMNLKRLEAISRIAKKRYEKAKISGTAMDKLNYFSAKVTSEWYLEAIKEWKLKISSDEYEVILDGYRWMFEK